MEKTDTEKLREKVPCAALLEKDHWKVDLKQSTRRAIKYRRGGGEILIVIHEGRGWFDPLSDDKGDVFDLARRLGAESFPAALDLVADSLGYTPIEPAWRRTPRRQTTCALGDRWAKRPRLRLGSPCWTYLSTMRALPAVVLQHAAAMDLLREGPAASLWARHSDEGGATIGWEERGPKWRGFASGGSKELFRFGANDARRVAVTEAAIDALSLAAIEGQRADTLYVSTGGGWSAATEAALSTLARKTEVELVAATDNDAQGEAFAARLKAVAFTGGCGWERLTPPADDWNDALRQQAREERTRAKG